MRPSRSIVCLVSVCAVVLGSTSLPAQAAHRHRGKEFPIPTANSGPRGIAAGPDEPEEGGFTPSCTPP